MTSEIFKVIMVYLMFLLTVCLAEEIWCTKERRQGGNKAIFPSTHEDTRNENFVPHGAAEWILDYTSRKPAPLKATEEQVTVGSGWWHSYASKLHLNRSGELITTLAVRDDPKTAKSFDHLDVLILDLVNALRLNFLLIYSNGSPSGKCPSEAFLSSLSMQRMDPTGGNKTKVTRLP